MLREGSGYPSRGRSRGMSICILYLAKGRRLPEWFTRSKVAAMLKETSACLLDRRGFCVWFTGIPGTGKTTIAEVLA